jgi:hypothetical protein
MCPPAILKETLLCDFLRQIIVPCATLIHVQCSLKEETNRATI